jgi:N-acetyl sugar amidotransferase
MPSTKPDLKFDESGVCSACKHFGERKSVDWAKRKEEFLNVVERFRRPNGSNYDCIVPVSGGKDSTYQTITLLDQGLNPLCVTATTCMLSDLGRRNIENLKWRGVDFIEYTPNPKVRRKLNRLGLTGVGDISWPEHVSIFTVPVQVSVKFNVPLIVWGENSQNEYGGPAAAAQNNTLNRRWLEEFGGLLGLRVSDLIGQDGIEPRHLIPYTYPTDAELDQVGTTGIFLGYYFPWDGLENALFSQAHGFETYSKLVEGSLVNYENLDNNHTGIHDYFKFLKYGFGRATDLACMHVRRGRMTRTTAIKLVREHDGKFPWVYLGCKLERILDEMDMSVDDFVRVCDGFTNKKLFKCDGSGKLIKDRFGNLTKVNYDNP